MNKRHAKLIKKWETASGYEALGKEGVSDLKTLRECLRHNQRWLEDHLSDITLRASRVALV